MVPQFYRAMLGSRTIRAFCWEWRHCVLIDCSMELMAKREEPEGELQAASEGREDGDDEDEEISWSSDSEIGDALDWLDLKDSSEAVDGAFAPSARRPNAHGGLQSHPNFSTLQPLSNRNQKFSNHIRASPLEEWEGRVNVGMSSSVTASIRESVRSSAIGKSRTHDKADRATVELAIDDRTRLVLFKMLNRGVFNDINGCISTGEEGLRSICTRGLSL